MPKGHHKMSITLYFPVQNYKNRSFCKKSKVHRETLKRPFRENCVKQSSTPLSSLVDGDDFSNILIIIIEITCRKESVTFTSSESRFVSLRICGRATALPVMLRRISAKHFKTAEQMTERKRNEKKEKTRHLFGSCFINSY